MRRSDPAARRAQGALIEERLRAAFSLSEDGHGARGLVDMSSDAITDRLKDAATMSSLCLELASVGEPGPGREPGSQP